MTPTNIVNKFRRYLSKLFYKDVFLEVETLKIQLKSLLNSEKVVVVYPEIQLKGLEKLKTPLYLAGEGNLKVSDTRLSDIRLFSGVLQIDGNITMDSLYTYQLGDDHDN